MELWRGQLVGDGYKALLVLRAGGGTMRCRGAGAGRTCLVTVSREEREWVMQMPNWRCGRKFATETYLSAYALELEVCSLARLASGAYWRRIMVWACDSDGCEERRFAEMGDIGV